LAKNVAERGKMSTNFVNESGLEFTDISSELRREYTFPSGTIVAIENPTHLNVSESGGHRIFDALGASHYIPKGWIHLQWWAFPGKPNFVK
jgi:hypothetical protein